MTQTSTADDVECAVDDGALNAPHSCALFLDVDGTLLHMATTPEGVIVPDWLPSLLECLAVGLGGALAIISGRQIVSVDRLLRPLTLSAAGVHGAELRLVPHGPIERRSGELPFDLVARLTALEGAMPGIRAEAKGAGFALHYREAPHVKDPLEAAIEAILVDYASSVVLSRGRKVFEVVPVGNSKGTALATLAALPAFRGRRPVMIGDDVGDEPAFAAALRLGGMALRVAGEHFGRDAANLDGPPDVHRLLRRVAVRLERTRS